MLIPSMAVFANDPPSAERRILLFLLFYGLMVGKYALICAKVVFHIFSGFA